MRPRVAVLLSESTRRMVLSEAAEERLTEVADVRFAAGDPAGWDLTELVEDAIACLSGWGTPPLSAELFAARPELRLVAHTAGSIRRLVPQELVGKRIVVCQSAAVIAESVAELVILQMLSSIRELHLHDAGLRAGESWSVLRERHPGRLLGAQTVGVIGASRTGQAVIGLLKAFGCRVLVVDPLLNETRANELGVELVSLETLLESSDVVTLHVPLLPETENLLGAAELARLRDGALLVNSARGGLIEPEALLAELCSGRIQAALDVFPREPLQPDSEWRRLPGILISPHAAGHTVESHRMQGDAMVEEIRRFVSGEPLQYEVAAEMVTVLA
jgi:phosphoglycerate dehydrogenase-like enzyme